MSPNAIYSKSGKGVQEASGKTSILARADRAVLSAIDGKMTLAEVAEKVGRPYDAKFEQLMGQLDKDGFVRQVSAGAPAAPAKPGARPAAPAAKGGGAAPGEDLDFTIAMPAPKAAPKPPPIAPAAPIAPHMAQTQAAAFAKAREEAEEKAARERERMKAEAEAKARAEMEAAARSEAAQKIKAEAEAKAKAEAEAKIKAARDAAIKAAAEAKAKAEAEAAEAKRQAEEAKRKAEEEARKAREEAERIRKEAEEAKRQAEEARRKAEEEARKVREEAERKLKEEAERRRKEEEARRAREEQERKEREAREKAEREAREKAEAERRAREERERKEREARERQEREAQEKAAREQREAQEKAAREQRQREEREAEERRMREKIEKAEREQRAAEEEAREEKERAERKAREKAEREREEEEREQAERAAKAAAKKKPEGKPESFGDSLLADLDSFSQREDEERKAKEEADRKDKEEARRRAEQAEREAKARAEREEEEKRRAEDERRRKEEDARRAREEEERKEREAQEAAERERKRKARQKDEPKPAGDDIQVSDDDLDMDEVRKDEAALSKESRRAAREREERERQARRDAKRAEKEAASEEKRGRRADPPPAPGQFRRPRKWGKMIATTLFLALVAGVGALHVMPISTAEYESAASQALGRPVKASSARLSLFTGVMLKFDGVQVGEARVAAVRAYPEIGSLFDENKAFSRIELEGVTVPQEAIGGLFNAKVAGERFRVARLNAKQVKLTGPVPLPPLEVDVAIGPDGAVTSTSFRGADNLAGKLVPKNADEMEVEVVAHSFTVPIVPDMTLSGFAMKGLATRDGVRIESWGGSSLDGAVAGSANVRWSGGSWNIDGVMTVRGINAAVFAPALLSEGKAEGTGRFSFNDADPMAFKGRGRIEGTFTVHKGVLGSFDLSRAITTGGRQTQGRTPFTGMSGQGVFDKGAVALRNVSFGAGALNAGASADISTDGNLSGRIVADVRTPSQTLRATLLLGGTVRDPQVRN